MSVAPTRPTQVRASPSVLVKIVWLPIILVCSLALTSCSTSIVSLSVPTTFNASLNASSDFIGASIVNYWPLPIHNSGVPGQTTSQVLARFSADVLNHGYARVIILCGTNDILQSTPNFVNQLTANLQSMALLAKNAGIEIYLSELPPLTSGGIDYNPTIDIVNAAITSLAAQQGYRIIDFNTPLRGHPEYFTDGIHPNPAGYAIMEKALCDGVLH